ncbi:GIY-YIG nuclease family protein [Salmonella enterica subsp. enterica serovar Tennessee]|nr:GIY-YIG nuclease family protein [Salmonella enterica]EED5478045.1 GIY-YIG nuclease family protein [Salmonella enterica subsp. enterica serovar Tennessee]
MINRNEPMTMNNVGYVYLIEDMERKGLVKIGKTRNPKTRLSSIRRTGGIAYGRTFVSNRIADSGALELRLHNLFDDRRVHGEWFRVDFETAKETLLSEQGPELSESELRAAGTNARNEEDEKVDRYSEFMRHRFGEQRKVAKPPVVDPIFAVIEMLAVVQHAADLQFKVFDFLKEVGDLKQTANDYRELSLAVSKCISLAQKISETKAIQNLNDEEAATFRRMISEKLKELK